METVTDKELAELESKISEEKAKEGQAGPAPQPEPTAPPPEPVQQEATPSESQGEDVPELAKKKGWKSAEDALKSYENMEREFHKKNQELSQLKNQQQGYTPPANPYYQGPPPSYAPPAPVYAPPPYIPPPQMPPTSYEQRMTEEQVAASYNLSVEDFRKVFPMIRDSIEAATRRQQAEMQQWREELVMRTEKSADMTEVAGDPAFHNPDVQEEIREIFSKNPTLFTQRRPYSTALKEALANIGRKNAMRGVSAQTSNVPTDPPKAVGNSSSSFSGRRNGGMPTVQEASKMTPEDLEKHLKGIRAFKTYEDLA